MNFFNKSIQCSEFDERIIIRVSSKEEIASCNMWNRTVWVFTLRISSVKGLDSDAFRDEVRDCPSERCGLSSGNPRLISATLWPLH